MDFEINRPGKEIFVLAIDPETRRFAGILQLMEADQVTSSGAKILVYSDRPRQLLRTLFRDAEYDSETGEITGVLRDFEFSEYDSETEADEILQDLNQVPGLMVRKLRDNSKFLVPHNDEIFSRLPDGDRKELLRQRRRSGN